MNQLGHEDHGLGTWFSTLTALASPAHEQVARQSLYPRVHQLTTRHWLVDVADRMGQTLATWRARQDQRAILAALDDHALADIGLSRGGAQVEAAKPFWRA